MEKDIPSHPPRLLKNILDLMFILIIMGLVAGIAISLWQFISSPENIDLSIMGHQVNRLSTSAIFLLISQIGLKLIFVSVLYLFRNLVRLFYRQELFSVLQVKSLNLIGQLLVILSLGKALAHFLAEVLLNSRLQLNIDADFGSFLFTLALGLFFVYLGKVFENARIMKEENKLTI